MNPDIFTGTVLLTAVIIGVTISGTKYMEMKAKYNFQARHSKEYKQLRKEADEWRQAYEEERAKCEDLNALLRVQNIVYGKQKVKDIKSNETDR